MHAHVRKYVENVANVKDQSEKLEDQGNEKQEINKLLENNCRNCSDIRKIKEKHPEVHSRTKIRRKKSNEFSKLMPDIRSIPVPSTFWWRGILIQTAENARTRH